jgi:hypothetical protein
MVKLYWSLHESRDRRYDMCLWFMEAKNSYLVVQSTSNAKYVPKAYKFPWKLQGNMSNYYLI